MADPLCGPSLQQFEIGDDAVIHWSVKYGRLSSASVVPVSLILKTSSHQRETTSWIHIKYVFSAHVDVGKGR